MKVRKYNASILCLDHDGVRASGAYGVRLESGVPVACSEHQAGLSGDPVAWLRKKYPKRIWVLIRDGGIEYTNSLRSELDIGLPQLLYPDEKEC